MVAYLPKCMRANVGSVPCDDWCYGVPNAEPPDHVCFDVFLGSIEHYIAAHLGLDELRVGVTFAWPTPMGLNELRMWYEQQETQLDRLAQIPDVSAEFDQRWREVFGAGPPPSQDDERLRLFDDFPSAQVMAYQRWSWAAVMEDPAPVPPVWGAPPVNVPGGEYWLGFVVQRPAGDSNLWLLGLLGRPTAAEFDGTNWYKWIHPVLQIESRAVKARELDAVNKQTKKLMKWYNRLVLGQIAREGGALGYFNTPSEFMEALKQAVASLNREYSRVTQQSVADAIPVSKETLRYNLKRLDPPLDWKRARNLTFLQRYIPPPDWK